MIPETKHLRRRLGSEDKRPAIDPYSPATIEEVITVIKSHDTYLKNFTIRRVSLLQSMESMDSFIQMAGLQGKGLDDHIARTNSLSDPVYKTMLKASDQLKEQAEWVDHKLDELVLEETKVIEIWNTVLMIDNRMSSILLDFYYYKTAIPDMQTKYGNVSEATLYRLRKQALEEVVRKCPYQCEG